MFWSSDELNHRDRQPLVTLPGMHFTSTDMWVDAQERAACVLINGDLIRVPF